MSTPSDRHYLTVTAAAARLGVGTSDVLELTQRGELPAVRVLDGELRIPTVAVDNQLLRISSRAMLVLSDADASVQDTAPRTRRERQERFKRRAQSTPAEYLAAFEAGELNLLDADVASLAVEAEDLLADARASCAKPSR